MIKRHYILTITDKDGDLHHYYFSASIIWWIPMYVVSNMLEVDFFGHTPDMTQDIEITEQSGPPDNGIVEIELK